MPSIIYHNSPSKDVGNFILNTIQCDEYERWILHGYVAKYHELQCRVDTLESRNSELETENQEMRQYKEGVTYHSQETLNTRPSL